MRGWGAKLRSVGLCTAICVAGGWSVADERPAPRTPAAATAGKSVKPSGGKSPAEKRPGNASPARKFQPGGATNPAAERSPAVGPSGATGQATPAEATATAKKGPGAAAELERLSPAREAAALAFASEQHPELSYLLLQLRNNSHLEYYQGVREVDRARERLQRTKERSSELYEIELRVWRLDSRIQLLAARLAMTENSSLEDELKNLLRERVAVRLEQMKFERERSATRIERLDRAIAESTEHPDEVALKDWQKIRKNLGIYKSKADQPGGAKPGTRPRGE